VTDVTTDLSKQERDERVERVARERLAADEATQRRLAPYTLKMAAREFWRHPSPWLLSVGFVGAWSARFAVGGWGLGDILVPVILMATFPIYEWLIHVFILHWKPRQLGTVTLDSLLARDHRRHHANPRDIPLVFIPFPTYYWLVPSMLAITYFAFPDLGTGLTWLGAQFTLGLFYEWTHFLVHSDYKPKTKAYKAVWRNHRLHHYKSEKYWFSVTSSGTSDRLFGTYPDPATVKTSPTAKNLHGAA
jgi:hypothetical protein